MSLSVSSITTSVQAGFEQLRGQLTGSVGVRATLGPETPTTPPGDVYNRVGTVFDLSGFASSIYATKHTVPVISEIIHAKGSAISAGTLAKGLGKNVGIGAAIGAGVSIITNGIALVRGKVTPGQAVGRVAAETVGAGVSALGSVVFGGLATAAFGAIGVAGLPLTLLGAGIGMVAGWITDASYRKSGAADAIYGGIAGVLGG